MPCLGVVLAWSGWPLWQIYRETQEIICGNSLGVNIASKKLDKKADVQPDIADLMLSLAGRPSVEFVSVEEIFD